MTDQTLKNTFQIQPVYASRQQWEALASQEVHQIDGKHVQDKALYGGITAVGLTVRSSRRTRRWRSLITSRLTRADSFCARSWKRGSRDI